MRLLSHHKTISILTMLAAVLLSASCMQTEEYNGDVGYLCAPLLDVEVTVENPVETKAAPVDLKAEGLFVPEVSDVAFTVTNKDGKAVYDRTGLWTEALILPVGDYTITATYGSNTFGSPYFTATATVTIKALSEETPQISITLANSLIRVSLSADMEDHFTPANTVSLTSGDVTHTADYGKWCYVPAGTPISLNLTGTNYVGNPAEFKYTLTAIGGKAYNVICKKDATNWPTVTISDQQNGAWANRLYITPGLTVTNGTLPTSIDDIKYEVKASDADWSTAKRSEIVDGYHVVDGLTNGTTYNVRCCIVGLFYSEEKTVTIKDNISSGSLITATHYNENGVLTGTHADLNLGLSLLAEGHILRTLYEAGLLKVENIELKKGSSIVRTASSENVRMTHSDGWPYLPKGTGYSLNFTHRLNSESSSILSSISNVVTVPEPSFTVTLGNTSYSTYDKYRSSGATEANKLTAETLYDASAFWTISSAIMGGSNYSSITKTLNFLIDGNTSSAGDINVNGKTSYTQGQLTGLAWGTHSLTATLVFDGIKATTSTAKTHEITGLPYKATPPSNSGNYPWTSKGSNTFGSEYVILSYSAATAPTITSPTFYIPNSINVNIYTKVSVENHWLYPSYNVFVRKYDKANDKYTTIYTIDIKKGKTYETSTSSPISTDMTTEYSSFYIQVDAIVAHAKDYIYYFKIDYR